MTRRAIRSVLVSAVLLWFLVRFPLLSWASLNQLRIPLLSPMFDPIPAGLEPFPPRAHFLYPPLLLGVAIALVTCAALAWFRPRVARRAIPTVLLVWTVGFPLVDIGYGLIANVPDTVAHALMSLFGRGTQGVVAAFSVWLLFRLIPPPSAPASETPQSA